MKLLRLFLIFPLVTFLCLEAGSQNQLKIYPDLKLAQNNIPHVNIYNGQQLDSIHYFHNGSNFLKSRSINYYNDSGLKINAIGYIRKDKDSKWWQYYQANYTYYQSGILETEKRWQAMLHKNDWIFLSLDLTYDMHSNLTDEVYFLFHFKKFTINIQFQHYIYNQNDLLDTAYYHFWDNLTDHSYGIHDYQYDEYGAVIESNFATNFKDDEIFPMKKVLYQYDEHGNMSGKLTKEYDRRNKSWKNLWETEFFLKDSLMIHTDYYNIEDGSRILETTSDFKYTNGNLTSYIKKRKIDKQGQFANELKQEFAYDEHKRVVSMTRHRWNSDQGSWLNGSKSEWDYNKYGNIEKSRFFIQTENGMFVLKSSNVYYWHEIDTLAISHLIIKNDLCRVFPNPVNNWLNIKINKESDLPIHYYLSKVSGEFVKSGQIESSQKQLNVTDLEAGMYLLSFLAGKHVQNEKILKL